MFYPLLYKLQNTTHILNQSAMLKIGMMTEIISGKVTEERNGDYLLEIELLVTDDCADLLDTQLFVKAKPNPTDEPQFFEIYNLQYKDKKSVVIKAKHIKHNLYNNFLVEVQNQTDIMCTPAEWWYRLCTGQEEGLQTQMTLWAHHFKFTSDITAKSSMTLGFVTPCTLGDFMGGADGSLIDVFGGEYKYDNFNVSLLKKRGTTTKYHLKWGKNLSSLTQTLDSDDICSHVAAYATCYDTYAKRNVVLCSQPQELKSHKSKLIKVKAVDVTNGGSVDIGDATGYWNFNAQTGENKDLLIQKLNIQAQVLRGQLASTNGAPTLNVKVDYPTTLDEMLDLRLCDTVYIDTANDSLQAKIIKTDYDIVLERWNSLELGTPKSKLSDYIVK